MAELRSERAAQAQEDNFGIRSTDLEMVNPGAVHDRTNTRDQDQGIRHGQLEEIEVEVGDSHLTPQRPKQKRQRPVRLGRDGKPLPPRKPRHGVKTFEDLARDSMVEKLLSESRLEGIYSPVEHSGLGTAGVAPGTDEAADERIAEEFRKEFLASAEEKNIAR